MEEIDAEANRLMPALFFFLLGFYTFPKKTPRDEKIPRCFPVDWLKSLTPYRLLVFVQCKAFAKHLMNIIDDHKRVRIDALYDAFVAHYLISANDDIDDLLFCAGECPFSRQKCYAAAKVKNLFGNVVCVIGNDGERFSGIRSILKKSITRAAINTATSVYIALSTFK